MKSLGILALTVFSLLTIVEPIWADEDFDQDQPVEALPDLDARVNTYFGVGALAPEATSRAGGLAGGATVEAGSSWRRLETGLLIMPTDVNTTSVALPLWAKFRVINAESQAWFVKAGAMSAFAGGGPRDFDVLWSVGVSGRLKFTSWADLVLDVTYNRSLLDPLSNQNNLGRDAGVLALAGLSIPF